MADPTDTDAPRIRIDLDGGVAVEADGSTVDLGAGAGDEPLLVLRMPRSRAHSLAHVLEDWSRAFRMAPNRNDKPQDWVLSRALEQAAAAVGDRKALACEVRLSGGVEPDQRLAAADVLKKREQRLTPLQRIAVVDAAARWMDEEDAGDQLAYALLAAVCSTDVTTSHAYLALLAPVADPEQ